MSTEQQVPDTEAADQHTASAADAMAENVDYNDMSVEIARLQADLASAEEKAKQNWDLVLRTKADAENLVRRAERNAESSAKFAIEKLCNELLEVMDGLDQGLQLQFESDEAKKVSEGMALTQRKLLSVLEKFGVKAIEAENQPFNPDLHEAMVAQENDTVAPNTVLMVLQKGYTLHGRLLRPSRVIVSRGPVQKIDENA